VKVLVVSGISGSGKSTFLRALEDIGYFCVDNSPIVLLQKFLEVYQEAGDKVARCAFVVDVRSKEFFSEGKDVLKIVKDRYHGEFVFLESSDDVILRRYKETRRMHPLIETRNIKEALGEERDLVKWIRNIADKVIDTSHLTTHELRSFVINTYGETGRRMKINLMSFGYAYGIPLESDMALDVRFLPNPFFIESLREKTGLSDDVADYVRNSEVFPAYFRLLLDFIMFLLPRYEKEGKSYLTISIGCTGGKHRSVFIVNELAKHLDSVGYNAYAVHRDIER